MWLKMRVGLNLGDQNGVNEAERWNHAPRSTSFEPSVSPQDVWRLLTHTHPSAPSTPLGLGLGSGFRVPGSGFRVQGSGFRVEGLGF